MYMLFVEFFKIMLYEKMYFNSIFPYSDIRP